MTEDRTALIERLRKRASQAGMLLVDPPRPSADMLLLNEAADALTVAGWQLIETAPKDGMRILLWIEPTEIAMPFQWIGSRWMGDDYPLNMARPTHWMPLPEGPKP